MPTNVIAGACPQCGSTNTEIVATMKSEVGETIAYGLCHHCGFQDMKLRGADCDMVVEQARRSFSTVYISDGQEVDGLPTVQALAHDISMLLKAICRYNDRCEVCPLHLSYENEPEVITDEGYFTKHVVTRIGCASQDESVCARVLAREFPGLPQD